MFKQHIFVGLIVFILTIYDINGYWRTDRKPKFIGSSVPMQSVMPYRKQTQRKIVLFHNYFRAQVVPKAGNMLRMKWHKKAAKTAQLWANKCMYLTHDNATGRHIDGYGACGQNIFVSSHLVPWLFAIKTWYLEKDNFTYGGLKNDIIVVGHYTQLVWATTHKVGCGLAKCQRNGIIMGKTYYNYICNYCPIGNRESKLGRPYKRGTPCRACKKSCYRKKLCTNSCSVADHWANCQELHSVWPNWLCNTDTIKGKIRLNSCRATCTCKGKLHD